MYRWTKVRQVKERQSVVRNKNPRQNALSSGLHFKNKTLLDVGRGAEDMEPPLESYEWIPDHDSNLSRRFSKATCGHVNVRIRIRILKMFQCYLTFMFVYQTHIFH